MPPRKDYKVRIRVGEVEIEVAGDREFVEQKIKEFKEDFLTKEPKSMTDQMQKPEVKVQQTKKITAKEAVSKGETITQAIVEESILDFKEFAREKTPRTANQKVMTIAYYLYSYEKRDFTYKDVKDYYERAGWGTLINPIGIVRNLIKLGYLEQVEDTEMFRISTDGIKYVENNFKI